MYKINLYFNIQHKIYLNIKQIYKIRFIRFF